jgi:hypothetical protein
MSRLEQNVLTKLDREAASTKIVDIRRYSEDVLRLFLNEDGGRAPSRSFAKRLSKAESQSRGCAKPLIPESQVAEAFNELMRHIAGESTTLKADAPLVKRVRLAFERPVPSLISRKKNGENCYPAEAVFLEGVLLDNVGLNPKEWGIERRSENDYHGFHREYRGFHRSEARAQFSAYLSRDPKGHAAEVMNHLAAAFGF